MTVTFDTSGAAKKESIVLKQGATLATSDLEITREGYVFGGWFTSNELIEANKFEPTTKISRNITLYAKWSKENVSINFIVESEVIEVIKVGYGESIKEEKIPSLEAYKNEAEGYYYIWAPADLITITNPIVASRDIIAVKQIVLYEIHFMVDNKTLETLNVNHGTTILENDVPSLVDYASEEEGYHYVWSEEDLEFLANPIKETKIIKAEKKVNEYKVVFTDGEAGSGLPNVVHQEMVLHGEGVVSIPVVPANPQNPLAIRIWDYVDSELNKITNNLTVGIREINPSIKILLFVENGKIVYGAEQVGIESQVITESAEYWQLEKPGYVFLGWFSSVESETALLITDFTYINLVKSTHGFVYAKFNKLPLFGTPEGLVITEIIKGDDERQLVISWTQAKTEGIYPTNFQFSLDGIVKIAKVNVDSSGQVSFNPFTDENGEIEEILAKWILDGNTHELKIKAINSETDREIAFSSKYSAAITYKTEIANSGDFYILDQGGTRYVFITDQTYKWGSNDLVEITDGAELFIIESSNTIRTTGKLGNFKISITKEGIKKDYDGLVIVAIDKFELGNSYEAYLQETGSNDELKTYLDKRSNDSFTVGYNNEFHFDVFAQDRNAKNISSLDLHLNYQIKHLGTTEFPGTYYEYKNGGILFKQAASDKEFTIEVDLKYKPKSIEQIKPISFTVTVQPGFNIYNSDEMRKYYADTTVTEIHVQRNFVASVAASDYDGLGNLYNGYGEMRGNVFARYTTEAIFEQKLMVNGNYLTIDGQKLPYAKLPKSTASVLDIITVQISIFMNNTKTTSSVNTIDYKNLTIVGSTATPLVTVEEGKTEESDMEKLIRTSGAHMGITFRSGDGTLENLRILNTQIGIIQNDDNQDEVATTNHYVKVDYLEVDNSWSNSAYIHNGDGLIVTNSYLKKAGGAAVHMVDTVDATGINEDPYLEIDNKTIIENWVIGDEAWFRSYGMQTAAIQLKTEIDGLVSTAGRSVIKEVLNEITGNLNERINIVLITEPHNPGSSKPSNSQYR